jgi:hypothetical protein
VPAESPALSNVVEPSGALRLDDQDIGAAEPATAPRYPFDYAPVWETSPEVLFLWLVPGLRRLNLAMQWQMGPPSGEKHDFRIAVLLVSENPPGRAARRVVLLLLGEGTVEADQPSR